jgi:hypothetical protein
MNNQEAAGRGAGTAGIPGAAGHPSPDAVQDQVDQAAYFNMFSMPGRSASNSSIVAPDNSNRVIGVNVQETLHRFSVDTHAPTAQTPLRACNRLGESVGQFTHRWLVIPDDFMALPLREPPPTPLDLTRSQRFVMLDGLCTFGDGRDGFRGFGAGHTVPVSTSRGPEILAITVGTILEGFGSFKGHEEGTYVHCGSLSPSRGFTGNLLLRVVDREGTFRADDRLPEGVAARPGPEPGITYIMFRGQAVPSDPVTPRIGPDGHPVGVVVEQGLRLFEADFDFSKSCGLRSTARVGPYIGRIIANIHPFDPGGTPLSPIPFATLDEMVFFDSPGGRRVGSFKSDCDEGRQFATRVAGQPAIRFGDVGRILSGTGPFQGIKGLMTDNSLVVLSPHLSASVYMLRLYDPAGRFRISMGCS